MTWVDLPCPVDVSEGWVCIEPTVDRRGCRGALEGDTPDQEDRCGCCTDFEEVTEWIHLFAGFKESNFKNIVAHLKIRAPPLKRGV